MKKIVLVKEDNKEKNIMKNKKLYLKLFCGIICSVILSVNCSAVTVKKHWWGEEYHVANNEISDFRLDTQSMLQKVQFANRVTQAVASAVGGVPTAIASEVVVEAQQISIDSLITDLERWEKKNVNIIVSLPGAIQGWSIKEDK